MHFHSKSVPCLKPVVREVQNGEQSQELRIPDGMPDVSRVITAWGQPIMRGKEWNSRDISYSGGMMVWVLYEPEGDRQPQVLNSWVPFQMHWDLPEGTEEGFLLISSLPKTVDVRMGSPRKLIVRCSMAVLARAYTETVLQLWEPGPDREGVELLENKYPVKLARFSGEKLFDMEQNLRLPDSLPKAEKIICCHLNCGITDCRVLADKLVFRGEGSLHLVYESENGELHSWDFSVPFSQYQEFGRSVSGSAQADITLAVTGLEVETDASGNIEFKGSLTAQYLILEQETLTVLEDAYCIGAEVELNREELVLPVVREQKTETFHPEQGVEAQSDEITDVQFFPDYPTLKRSEGRIVENVSGTFQVLCRGEDGKLLGYSAKWNQEHPAAGEQSETAAIPRAKDIHAIAGHGSILMKGELLLEELTESDLQIPQLTGIRSEAPVKQDPGRPSMILQRIGTESLWEIAKACGTDRESIREINHLEGEPVPGQILLISIP